MLDAQLQLLSGQLWHFSQQTGVGGLGRVFDTQTRLTGGQDAAGGEPFPGQMDSALISLSAGIKQAAVMLKAFSPQPGVQIPRDRRAGNISSYVRCARIAQNAARAPAGACSGVI